MRRTATKAATAVIALLVLVATFFVAGTAHSATQTLAPTADTYVQYDKPTENFGTSVRWSAEGRANIWRNALIRFNVVVPEGEKVVSAKLRAYSEASTSSTEFVDVYGTTGNWTESGVTWNNAPARGTWLDKQGGFSTGTWVEWDVTYWVGANGGYTNFKLETNAQKWVGFKSKETTSAGRQPQLVIVTEPVTTPTTTPTPTPTATPTPTPTVPPAGDGTTAAATQGWGPVVAGDEFNYTGAPDTAKWDVYDSPGHAGNGVRSPAQASVDGTKLNIAGTANGTTAGMSAKFANQKYGRWEARIAASGDNEYHMVSILWPTSNNWPCDGEVDYAETTGDWNVVKFFHHYSCSNTQTSASKAVDVSQFHNYAVDWSPSGMVGYIDGVKWFEDNDPTHQPPGTMRQTLQLDWFPDATADGPGEMRVDWVRVHEAATGTTPTPTSTPTPTPTNPPTGGSFDFATVGDMNPSGHSAATTESGKNAISIKNALASGELDAFIGLGDFQYSIGHCGLSGSNPSNDHYSKYNTQWGPFKDKTYWTAAPNHDYQPGRNTDLDDYMDGGCVNTVKSATSTDPTRQGPNPAGTHQENDNWYSIDKGNWHILFAPSNLWRYNVAKANAATAQMDANLAAAKAAGKHLAVVVHDPYFTSNTSSHTRSTEIKPWIDVFWKNRVKVLFSGSQHNYERSCPVNNADQCVADGMQQFQVSTGGISLRDFTSNPAYIEKKFTGTWGHLRMSLKDDGSYSWQFVPTSGNMANTDSGSRQ